MNRKGFRLLTGWGLLLLAGIVSSGFAWAGSGSKLEAQSSWLRMEKGSSDPLEIVSMDDRGLTLALTLPPFEMEAVRGPGGDYQKIQLPGWARTAQEGRPELPLKGLLIQVPSSGGIVMEVLENVEASLPDCRIVPVPRLALSDRGETILESVEDEEAYRASQFFPGPLAKVGPQEMLRGLPVARVTIYPFQWNPTTRELRYSTKVRLRVAFETPLPQGSAGKAPAAESGVEGVYDALLQGIIVNYRGRGKARNRSLPKAPAAKSLTPEDASIKIEVKRDGIYRVTYEDLFDTGVDAGSIDPRTFQLFHRGTEIALKVVSQAEGPLRPGDSIEFYGQGMDNPFTDTNVYRLRWGTAAGKRVAQIDGEVTGQGEVIDSFRESLQVEENHTMWEGTPGAPQEDYWFWERITAPATRAYSIQIPSPVSHRNEATVRIGFRGRSTASPHPNHHTVVYLNGTRIDDHRWDGQVEHVRELTVPSSLLIDGANTVTVQLPGDTGAVADVVYLNWIEIDYGRRFEAVRDSLMFTVSGEGRLQMGIRKLSRPDIRIYDITDPEEVQEVVHFSIQPDGPDYRATFEAPVSGARTYYVLAGDRLQRPDRLLPWQSANLKDPTNGADYLLITAQEFLPSVEPLLRLRQGQGWRVQAVSVEEIYNEVNDGLFDPQAIKDFLRYAYESWEPPAPTYVLLVGDANTDYRDYFGTGKANEVPVHLSITSELGLTPDDNWYACVEGDDALPDLLIGRLPGGSPERAAGVIDKLVRFEGAPGYQPPSALFVADNDDGRFEALNEELIGYLPPEFQAKKVYLRRYGNVDAATRDIVSHLDQGMVITSYVGHGSVTNWAGELMFESSDVASLNNGDRLTWVITLNCLNGYFSQPYRYSLAEEFVVAPDRGAFGAFSPSGLGYPWEHEMLSKQVFSALFERGETILGSIATGSKIAAYARGVSGETLKTFTLFGDPAARLKMGRSEITPLTLGPGPLPEGEAGVPYQASLEISGGVPPYTVRVVKGAPPPGLSLDPAEASWPGRRRKRGRRDSSWRAPTKGARRRAGHSSSKSSRSFALPPEV